MTGKHKLIELNSSMRVRNSPDLWRVTFASLDVDQVDDV